MFVIGKIKGFEICNINSKSLKKNDFFLEIERVEPRTREIIDNALKEKWVIYGFKKNNTLKAIYLFARKGNLLNFSKEIFVTEITEEIKREFENVIFEDLKENVSFGEYKKIEWKDKDIVPKEVKIGNFNISYGVIGMLCGIILGNLVANIGLGIALGILFGATTGVIVRKKK